MERIVITGSNGIIGTVLTKGLSDNFEITPLDLPDGDVRNYNLLLEAFPGNQAVIHLAWNTKDDNSLSDWADPDNMRMYQNVYMGAYEARVPRVIMASSVHADRFSAWKSNRLMSPYRKSEPLGAYGSNKVAMEIFGERFARVKGLEVVNIRFGGVQSSEIPTRDAGIEWLSHRDLLDLIKKILQQPHIPKRYAILYAVSKNKGRVHDVTNPFGWFPQDSLENYRE